MRSASTVMIASESGAEFNMFGSYRYLLAHMVVIAHLWKSLAFWTGTYAVFSFYLLSGFLMCMVLNTSYGYTVSGIRRFLVNRALRIYPPYLIVLAVTATLLLNVENFASPFNVFVRFPVTEIGWIHNLFIFGINGPLTEPRMVPQSWSLDVELCFYVAMALLLTRSKRITTLWLIASVGYTVFMVASGVGLADRYTPLQAASLPFSLGAALFFYRDLVPTLGKRHIAVAVALFVLNAATAEMVWGDPWTSAPFYVSLFLSLAVIATLMRLDRKKMPDWFVKLDDRLGDLSYPIFLCHWAVTGMVVHFMFDGTQPLGATLFLSSIAFVNLLALAINLAIDGTVNELRTRIRQAAMAKSEAAPVVPS
jgi:peptidoglycan/LPS O-acetylase OafA/YrhL